MNDSLKKPYLKIIIFILQKDNIPFVEDKPRPIKRSGMTCFIIVIMQCLMNMSTCREFIKEKYNKIPKEQKIKFNNPNYPFKICGE